MRLGIEGLEKLRRKELFLFDDSVGDEA